MNQSQDIKMQPMELPPPYSEGPSPPVSTPYQSAIPVTQPIDTVYQPNVLPTVIPVVVGQRMGPKESPITCVSCNMEIMTKVEYKATMRTHLFAALLCIMGCWLCMCIPYCMDSCQNVNHYCPNCNAYIGSYVN